MGAQPFQIVPDDQDYDNDASTDQYYLTSWADFAGVGWPVDGNTGNPLDQPVDLYSVPVTATSEFSEQHFGLLPPLLHQVTRLLRTIFLLENVQALWILMEIDHLMHSLMDS